MDQRGKTKPPLPLRVALPLILVLSLALWAGVGRLLIALIHG